MRRRSQASDSEWRPTIEVAGKILLGSFSGQSHADIARRVGADAGEFSAWLAKMRGALKSRPDAFESIRFLLDLQKFETRPDKAPIGPADLGRRDRALERAEGLAAAMPDGWPPGPPVQWMPELHAGNNGGWHFDDDGVKRRERRKKPRSIDSGSDIVDDGEDF